MTESENNFRNFEHSGWEDDGVCKNYHKYWSRLTTQSIPALLEIAGVRQGGSVLDVAAGAGYVAGAATERGATATGIERRLSPFGTHPRIVFAGRRELKLQR